MQKLTKLLFIVALAVTANTYAQLNLDFAGAFVGANQSETQCSAVDANGNIYVAGVYDTAVDFDFSSSTATYTNTGNNQGYICKFSSTGTLVWAKTLQGTGSSDIKRISINSNNEIILGGTFQGTVDLDPSNATYSVSAFINSVDFFMLKLTSNGSFISAAIIAGPANDLLMDMHIDNSGNIFVSGTAGNNCDFDPSPAVSSSTVSSDAFLAKYDANFNLLFVQKNLGTFAVRVLTNAANEIYLAGIYQGTVDVDSSPALNVLSSNGLRDSYVVKYSATGSFIWAYSYGGTASDELFDMNLSGNDVIISGGFRNTVDFDNSASTFTLSTSGVYNGVLIKLNQNGNLIFAKQFQSNNNSSAESLFIDANGEINTLVYYVSSVDLDPGMAVSNLTCALSSYCLVKLSSSGNLISYQNIAENNPMIYTTSLTKSNQDYIVTGWIDGTVGYTIDFDHNVGVTSYSVNPYNGFFVKYSPITTNINSQNEVEPISIFPNPSENYIHVKNNIPANSSYKIYDSNGSMKQAGTLDSQNQIITLGGLVKGVYFLRINNSETIKFVKH